MYGFQPKHARGKPAQALADGGLVHSITGMLGMRKRTPEEMLAADAKVQERNLEAADRVAARAKPAQPAVPAEEKAVSGYAGMSALQRREKELGLKDGGMVRGPGTGTPTKTQPSGDVWAVSPLEGVGEYWSKSNADFEAQNPNLLQRGVRAINPITGFGSAVGAMHDGASSGSMRDMAIAAMQALPVFGAMRTVAPTMKSIAGAAPVLVPSAAKTAAGVAAGTTAGVAADVAQEQQQTPQPQQRAVTEYSGMSATQRREKELGLKDGGTVGGFKPGGLIRGPGTGTSDSIETEKRPGTFIMPADSTQAIGPEALQSLGAPKGMPEAEGMEEPGDMDDRDEPEGEKVPVRLSNGEFELPPEQVQALGEAVLTVLRDATHTPAESGNPTNKGFAPNQFFANGGTVFGSRGLAGLREVIPKVQAMGYPQAQQPAQAPAGSRDLAALKAMIPKMEAMGYPQALADGGTVRDEEKQRLANQSAMYVLGAQTAAANRQPAPPEAAASQVQNQVPTRTAAPFATTAPTSAGFMPGTRAVFNESGKAIGDLANQGRYAAAAGETARAALAYVPAVVDDVVGGAVRAVGPALADAGKQFLGMNEAPAPAPAPVPAAASKNPRPAAPTGTTQASSAPTGQVAIQPMDDGAQPVAPTQSTAAAPQPQAEQVAPGAYRYGRGQYGDSPTGQQGVVPGPAGQPNAQNMAAADALAARQTPAGFQPAGSQPAGVQAPVVRNSSNDWAARKALANAETAASSITNTRRWGGKGAESSPDVQAYQAMLRNDLALQQAQPGMDKAAMDSNTALQREGIQQAGATGRTAMQEQGATAREAGRTALAGEEMGLKRTAAGFQTRAAAKLESLQNAYAAEKDPAKQAILARQIREFQGKEQPARYKVAAGGQQIDANGVAYKVPDRVFNEQTGEFADGSQQARQQPYPDGARLQGKDGKFYVVRNGKPVAE